MRIGDANAEILGVVVLIGIFAISAGIISATTFSSPQPVKVPAASLEITGESGAIRIAHLGGDPLPPDSLVRGINADGTPDTPLTLNEWLGLAGKPLSNGYSTLSNRSWSALVITWGGSGGESVIASWDPSGLFGPLGPVALGGGSIPGTPYVPVTPPPAQTPETGFNNTLEGVVANFTPLDGTSVMVGEAFTFDDRSTGNITTWSWTFGDGSTYRGTAPGAIIPHVYPYSGSFMATLTVSNNVTGAHDTVMHTIIVTPGLIETPAVDFTITPRDSGNRALNITCLASTSPGSLLKPTAFQWETADGQDGTTTQLGPYYGDLMANPARSQTFSFVNHDGITNNICTVKLSIWSPYLTDPLVITKTVIVGPALRADFLPNITAGIAPQPVRFLDVSAGVIDTWHWDFGDGTTNATRNPEHIFMLPGTYTVTLTVTGYDQSAPGGIATSTIAKAITMEDRVVANFTADRTVGEPGLVVTFTDLSTGNPEHWQWYFGDGQIFEGQTPPPHTYAATGNYTVSLIAEKFDPDSYDAMVKVFYIRIGSPVVVDFSGTPTSGLPPFPVQFTDLSSGGPTNWSWDFGDGATSTEQNPVHVYSATGNYNVTLTASTLYRSGTLTKTSYIHALGPVTANFTGAPLSVPVNRPVQFTDLSTGGPDTWLWNFGDGTTSDLQNPSHNYIATGTYSVTLTASHSFSSNTITRSGYVTVINPVAASFTRTPPEGRSPLTVTFTDTSTGNPDNWRWDFGDGTTYAAKTPPPHLFIQARNYTVNLTVWNSAWPGLTSTATATIRVYATPVASFTADRLSGTAPLLVTFTDTSTGNPYSWLWNFGDSTTSSQQNPPTHTYTTPGNYTVLLRVTNPAGSSTTSRVITVLPSPPVAAFTWSPTNPIRRNPVQFTDQSTNSPTTWLWNFGDGTTSTTRNPTHSYQSANTYTVSLTVSNAAGQSTTTHTIVVGK